MVLYCKERQTLKLVVLNTALPLVRRDIKYFLLRTNLFTLSVGDPLHRQPRKL